ncbi:DUF2158 domain-containing protein [Aeromonas veronii]|uniref:DUF2158 domain-containing protein n=1 Tax=Aeromonas veronii TaxID=654 RepID=UPI003006A4D0
MQKYQYFYPGQVVKLSGGSYPMTVKPAEDEDDKGIDACCVWFNTDMGGEPIEWTFPSRVWFNTDMGGEPIEWTFPSRILKLQENQEQYGYLHTRFEPGAAVRLRSGGPSMTVKNSQSLTGVTLVFCIWHDKKSREPLMSSFPSEMLVAV